MKKMSSLLTMLCLVISLAVASVPLASDNFVGEWDLLVEGTPQGNINVILTIERVDGKLKGKFRQIGSNQETTISNISEQENGITLYFFAEGYDLYLSLKAADEGKLSGYLVDQFPVKGQRASK
ncbi:hypothetical protein [Cecembia calidifontis]|jgi:hypothetical protein|uniref:Uncharacterized protein n=1 Tax=Cecembia calidifontis TaxID=1187080 RepID=A0A4Q7P6P6_9BACT|nr:hypothetical protein [Cecembia calidifontis]RZS95681.1 hypothetical protein BC751_1219 [Cecembia calidifontis]